MSTNLFVLHYRIWWSYKIIINSSEILRREKKICEIHKRTILSLMHMTRNKHYKNCLEQKVKNEEKLEHKKQIQASLGEMCTT